MSNHQLIGIILFATGLVPFAIGGLVFLRYSYETVNAELLPDPKWSWWDRKIGFKGVLAHPKSRWWCGIGFPICLAGFAVLIVSTISVGQIALFTAVFALFFGLRELIARRRR